MNQKIKRLIGYLIYLAVFGGLILTVEQFGNYYQEIFRRSFQIPYGWVLFVMIGFPLLVGLLLALPKFVKTARQDGAWKVDWVRLIVLGLPGLLFVLAYMACMAFPQWMALMEITNNILGLHQGLVKIAGLLLGFVLLNSFSKVPDAGYDQR
jgi:hypothetical protein